MNQEKENKGLYLSEAMDKFNKKFKKNKLNILKAHAGSGKTSFIFKDFLYKSYKYVDGLYKQYYAMNLDKILYVCDTNMLKSSVLQDHQNITKILQKDDLKKAMKSKSLKQLLQGDIGYIKVITYSTMGWLLQQEGSKHIILNYYRVIIMDEIHNLFKYASRFDNENNNKPYTTVIDNLNNVIHKTLLIGMSATTGIVYSALRDKEINTHTIFTYEELKQIRQLGSKWVEHTNCVMNEIKRIALNYDWFVEQKNYKVMIYTNTIKQSKKYKEFLEDTGYKVEWLCSINAKQINSDGEKVPVMNDRQIEIRDGLLENGNLPNNLDVLIINSGYETGWNLTDERVQYVYIDSTDEDTHIQARNRVRHDVKLLCLKVKVDWSGEILEYDQYRQLQRSNNGIGIPLFADEIEEKFIGVKLTLEDKKHLVNKYAVQYYDEKDTNWKTFKRDLERAKFIVKTEAHGTYIFRQGEEVKRDMKQLEKKERAEDIIKEYMNVKLFGDKQTELQDKLISIKVKTNGKGTLGKKMVQSIVENCGYVFVSKPETKGEMRKKTYWYITEIEIAG